MKHKPKTKTIPLTADLLLHFDGQDEFLIADGERIAKRGQPGTPQAGSWIALDPTYEIFNDACGLPRFRRR